MLRRWRKCRSSTSATSVHEGTLVVICINVRHKLAATSDLLLPVHGETEANGLSQGGPITQVEQEEMPRLLKEAQADAKMSGVDLRTRLVTMDYADFLEEY